MRIIIDGYNVLFALALVPKTVRPGDLQRARQYLLDLLKQHLGPRTSEVAVVFDAAGAPPGAPGDYTHHGIDVHFAQRKEADDLIERLVLANTAPSRLIVISSDFRLRQAAERRGGKAVRSEDFLTWLEAQKPTAPTADPQPDERPDERRQAAGDWLAEFGHLDQDPSLGGRPKWEEDFLKGE